MRRPSPPPAGDQMVRLYVRGADRAARRVCRATSGDPADGCNIAEEYVYLSVQVTQNRAVNGGSWVNDPGKIASYNVAAADNATSEARFIAPLAADLKSSSTWIAGGRHIWVQTHGYAIRSGDEWKGVYDLGAGRTATAVAASGGKVYAAWCGPCDNKGFARGIADGTGRHDITLPADGTVPNRYLSGFAVDPKNADHVFLAVATDLGVVHRAPGRTTWQRVGSLPAVAVLQPKLGPDGSTLYAATHGRGVHGIKVRDLG